VFPAFSSREVNLGQTGKIGIHFIIYQNKHKQMKEQVPQHPKKCNYVVPSSKKLFKTSQFWKIGDNSMKII